MMQHQKMRHSVAVSAIAAFCLFGILSSAYADGNPPGPKGGPGYGPAWEKFFAEHPKLKNKIDQNNDGVIDGREWGYAHQRWPHLNPPGPMGGPGYGPRWDKDNNPPGPIGGRGTNWENPPGPKGGPGSSPNRRHW